MDHFEMHLTESELRQLSALRLAHVGDAVHELLVRSWLCTDGRGGNHGFHRMAVKYVSAPAQAESARRIGDRLTQEELAVFRRGRNARVQSVPKNASVQQYHAATGLEMLFGYLYLAGRRERLSELFMIMMEDTADAT